MVGWLRRLCGGWVVEAMWGVRNAGNKAQLRPAGAGALPELGKNKSTDPMGYCNKIFAPHDVAGDYVIEH